jgi:hypothetical protein
MLVAFPFAHHQLWPLQESGQEALTVAVDLRDPQAETLRGQ